MSTQFCGIVDVALGNWNPLKPYAYVYEKSIRSNKRGIFFGCFSLLIWEYFMQILHSRHKFCFIWMLCVISWCMAWHFAFTTELTSKEKWREEKKNTHQPQFLPRKQINKKPHKSKSEFFSSKTFWGFVIFMLFCTLTTLYLIPNSSESKSLILFSDSETVIQVLFMCSLFEFKVDINTIVLKIEKILNYNWYFAMCYSKATGCLGYRLFFFPSANIIQC